MCDEIKLSHESFLDTWRQVCQDKKENLTAHWNYPKQYTKYILGENEDSIINKVAAGLKMKAYQEYYKLDAVFYGDDDFFNKNSHNSCRTEHWLKRIRTAFEHENDPHTMYREFSHLLTTNADLRVLVTYSCKENPLEMKGFIEDQVGNTEDIEQEVLVIIGYMDKAQAIKWDGYAVKKGKAKELANNASISQGGMP